MPPLQAHLGPVTGLAVSPDGTLCASISTDRTAKVSGDSGRLLKLLYARLKAASIDHFPLPTACHCIPTLPPQVFDVASFDMIAMLRLPWVPGCVEWCFRWEEAVGGSIHSKSTPPLYITL